MSTVTTVPSWCDLANRKSSWVAPAKVTESATKKFERNRSSQGVVSDVMLMGTRIG